MSVKALSWVLDNSEAPGNDRLVLIAIADEADDDGTNAYPSIDRIARRARVNKRTTMRALERLEESGDLVVVRPEKSGRGHYNRYGLVMGRDPDDVRALVEGRQSVTLPAPLATRPRKGAEGRATARNGAPMSAPDPLTHRPIEPTKTLSAEADARATDSLFASGPDPSSATGKAVAGAYPADFEAFYAAYPLRKAKKAGFAAWRKARVEATAEAILGAAERFAAECRQQRTAVKFIPHPASWLNAGRYADYDEDAGGPAEPWSRHGNWWEN